MSTFRYYFLINPGTINSILKEQESLDVSLYALVLNPKYFIQVNCRQSSKGRDGLGEKKSLLPEALPSFPECFPKLTDCWTVPSTCVHGSRNQSCASRTGVEALQGSRKPDCFRGSKTAAVFPHLLLASVTYKSCQGQNQF